MTDNIMFYLAIVLVIVEGRCSGLPDLGMVPGEEGGGRWQLKNS